MKRIVRPLVLLVLLALLGGCGGGGGVSCTPAPTITSSPPTTATAGYPYVYVVNAQWNCLLGICNSIDGITLPEGAIVDDYYDTITWAPSSALIGQRVYFNIATEPDFCGDSATQSWYVIVYAPPVIESFNADRISVSPGETATLTASFEGSGAIEGLGSVASGVPVTTSPLQVTTTFTLSVQNDVGAVAEQSITIEVLDPPVIESFTASPAIVTAGGTALLRWSISGDYSEARIDPMGDDVLGRFEFSVTPAETTSYTLYLVNAAGNSTTATTTVEVVSAPIIESFTATPSSSLFQGSVLLSGTFSYGSGEIERDEGGGNYVSIGSVASGEIIDSGGLLRSTRFRLVVTNAAGSVATRMLLVPITGPGTFQPTAGQPFHPTRSEHSATKLLDGSIFIAGGRIDGISSVTTERFDPISETFIAGPNLLEGRRNHTASLLPDGRILLVGGYRTDATRILNAEIYDPAAGTIVSAGALPVGDLVAPQSIALADGRVLIVHSSFSQGSEIFDPATDQFSPIGPLLSVHGCIALAPLLDTGSRVLIVDGNPSSSTEIFSPATDSFALSGAVSHHRCYFASAPLPGGRVLITGGGGAVPSEIYDPLTGLFHDTSFPNYVSSHPVAVTLNDNRVLITGGLTDGRHSPWAELYDPIADQFVLTGGLLDGHRFHSATLLDDGRVLVVGGCNLPCTAELYTP